MTFLPPEPFKPETLRAATEEWLVAVTIATEVPPEPAQSANSKVPFTAEMIPLAVQAVAETVLNRVTSKRFQPTALDVVLAVKQFSGTLRGLPASAGHKDFWRDGVAGRWYPAHVALCLATWRRIRGGSGFTPVAPGALYYYSPVSMVPPHRVPSWAGALTPVPVVGLPLDYFTFYR